MKIKKILTGALSVIMAVCFMANSTSAAVQATYDPEKGMYLVSTKTYYDENMKSYIVEKNYSSVNPLVSLFRVSGEGTFRNDKTDSVNNISWWVSGYFTWNGETATVSNASRGYSGDKTRISNESITSASNQGDNFLLGNKYAYARYSFSFKNIYNMVTPFSTYVEVNRNGTPSYS